jgi:hypothetical protein
MATRKASQHLGREAALVLPRRRRRLHRGDVGAVLAALVAAVALVQEGPEGVYAVLGRLRHRHALDELVRVGVLGVVAVEHRGELGQLLLELRQRGMLHRRRLPQLHQLRQGDWAVGARRVAREHGVECAGPGVTLGQEAVEVEDLVDGGGDGGVLELRRRVRSRRPVHDGPRVDPRRDEERRGGRTRRRRARR